MEDYLQAFEELKDKVSKSQKELEKSFNLQPDQTPLSVFSMIHNHIILGIELFGFYKRVWSRKSAPTELSDAERERIKDQNAERIIEMQKMIFVKCVSSFEYAAKEYHKIHPDILGNIERNNGRTYLWDILKKSNQINLLEAEEHNLWKGLLNFRNMIVHNNAVSDTTETYEYPNCKLEFFEGKMVKGNLLLFTNLLDWMVDAIKDWIINIEAYNP